jgi:hypothetical protein
MTPLTFLTRGDSDNNDMGAVGESVSIKKN